MGIELPEGVERFSPQIAGATDEGFLPMDEIVDGAYIRYSDLPAIIAANRDRALLELVDRWAEAGGERDKLCPPIRETVDAIIAQEREKWEAEFREMLAITERERDQARAEATHERQAANNWAANCQRAEAERDQAKAQALAELRERLTNKSFVEETINEGKAFIADLECLFDALSTLDQEDQLDKAEGEGRR